MNINAVLKEGPKGLESTEQGRDLPGGEKRRPDGFPNNVNKTEKKSSTAAQVS